MDLDNHLRQLDRNGYFLLPAVFSAAEVQRLRDGIREVFASLQDDDGSILGRTDRIYGARNLLAIWPAATEVWRQQPLPHLLKAVLGTGYGCVRGLYFDKPPERTWSLPWHKDLTIAVRDNQLPTAEFSKPTRKAGVPHVEASLALLEQMLTLRIHLDDVTNENGPLRVLPGSQRTGKSLDAPAAEPRTILARAGDVLVMRPLLTHCSISSDPGTSRHRRIVHLEFASSPHLPGGYEWHDFIPGEVRT